MRGPFTPSGPERLSAITIALIAAGSIPLCAQYTAPAAPTHEQIARIHGAHDMVGHHAGSRAASPEAGLQLHRSDTDGVNHTTLDAARHAAGAAVLAVDSSCAMMPHRVLRSAATGHHAERGRAAWGL